MSSVVKEGYLKMVKSGLIFFAIIMLCNQTTLGSCDAQDKSYKLEGKFRILKVKKAKVRCNVDKNENPVHDDYFAEIAGCEVRLKDLKTGKEYTSYAGSKGCMYKTDQIRDLKINFTCCARDEHVSCDLKDPVKVLNYDMPMDDNSWFCASIADSYVIGAVKD